MGATVAFLLARSLAADWVEHRLGRRAHEIKAGVEREGWRFVALSVLVPGVPTEQCAVSVGYPSLRSTRVRALSTVISPELV